MSLHPHLTGNAALRLARRCGAHAEQSDLAIRELGRRLLEVARWDEAIDRRGGGPKRRRHAHGR
jgi:hypothetical protein